tara:strand:+ start:7811 stop:8119 length:309 start_codon:yes stop_codon:yes gene_type:complete
MIRFIEVVNQTNFNPRMERTSTPQFIMGEVWINPQYVVSIREAGAYKSLLKEGLLPTGLDESHAFTTVTTTNGGRTDSHVVVGTPQTVATRLNPSGKSLLKG